MAVGPLVLIILAIVTIAIIAALAKGYAAVPFAFLLGGSALVAVAVCVSYLRFRMAANESAAESASHRTMGVHEMIKARRGPIDNDSADPPQPEVAEERPAWVDAPPSMSGKVYRSTLLVGPYSTTEECEEQLLPALRASAAQYVERVAGIDAAAQVSLADGDLRRYVLREVWQEPVNSSVGPMVKLHALLEYDDAMRKQVEQLWRSARVHSRLSFIGAALAGVLVCLSGVHWWLRPARSALPNK
ncbi:MAG TPA: hypothetical protein VHV77_04630 [Pirellulales bacterium]|nr:hypothetical protein [Pirellulales bacterium]